MLTPRHLSSHFSYTVDLSEWNTPIHWERVRIEQLPKRNLPESLHRSPPPLCFPLSLGNEHYSLLQNQLIQRFSLDQANHVDFQNHIQYFYPFKMSQLLRLSSHFFAHFVVEFCFFWGFSLKKFHFKVFVISLNIWLEIRLFFDQSREGKWSVCVYFVSS